ncbi:MAG: ATP-binding cassette domain-containing protein, partial [Thermoanaerobaculia bacterium]|nr:ATP-binding cassette domain-containing protein [Thermoanaerobaculia bacterium]
NSLLENREQVAIAGGGGDPEANSWRSNYWSDYRGYDADEDGFGDVPHRSDKLFESLMDRNAELRLFSWSPVVQAVDFAARAFPLVKPDPKLTDPVPRMEPEVPAGPPRLGGPEDRGLLSAGIGLAALALLLMAGPGLALSRGATMRRMSDGRTEETNPRPRPIEEPPDPLVELRNVGKRFGDTVALEDVSFVVERGESVALWGPNGAGKTTALRSILGVMPHEGEVVIGGFESRQEGKRARRLIGFVPQESSFPDLRAVEVAELFARLHRVSLDRVSELFRTLGLEGEEEKQVANLSGGRKQRLALAVALLSDPPLLILDEPTASLDVTARREFLDLLVKLKNEGKTMVFSSHRPDEVRILADRVLRLEEGRLVGSEEPSVLSGEGPEVELELAIDPDDLDRAAHLLEDRGFAPRRRAGWLRMRVPADGKIDPIALLLQHEIDLDDFRTEKTDAEPA